MYNAEYFFVDNPLNRYTLSSRSALKTNPDGSTDLYIQKDSPGPDKESNWLPAPPGRFILMMRLYWPKEKNPLHPRRHVVAAGGEAGQLGTVNRVPRISATSVPSRATRRRSSLRARRALHGGTSGCETKWARVDIQLHVAGSA